MSEAIIKPEGTGNVVDDNWNWFLYTESRGHRDYCQQAKKCDRFYMGKGKHWDADVKAELNEKGIVTVEVNEIKPAINIAAAYQINNRMDVALFPRGGDADQQQAEVKSKVLRQFMDNEQYRWRETEVWMDGIIQQRGYFDIDVKFDDQMYGAPSIGVHDPLDVRPDPDSKSYDPDDWGFVIITRWMTLDWVEKCFGKKKRQEVEDGCGQSADWGESLGDEERSSFGDAGGHMAYSQINGIKRVRIIDRQFFSYEMTAVLVSPEGDIVTEESFQQDEVNAALEEGWVRIKKMRNRARRVMSSSKVELFNAYTPTDEHYTVVPYFPIFRRGDTSGLVDDAISPSEMLNQSLSKYQHVVNSTANSGYYVEEGSLANMTAGDLEERGAETGVVIEYKKGFAKPEKIQPNRAPEGINNHISMALGFIRDVTGISEAMVDPGKDQSGVAIQARQFIAQQQLAIPLDNMARTRYMVVKRLLKILQKYCTREMIVRIAEDDYTGQKQYVPITINQRMPDGSVANDMTSGKYDIIITEKPMTVSWENSEFEQSMEMRKEGINIPDAFVIKHSNLSDKGEIIKLQQEKPQADPAVEAKARLDNARAKEAEARAISTGVESMYSATTAANLIAGNPSIAPMADAMLKSAGYVDQDAGPIVPEPASPMPQIPMDENTHPLLPPNPDVGMTATPMQGIGR